MRPGTATVLGVCLLAGCATGEGLLIDVVADPDIPVPVGAIDVWVGAPDGVGPATFLRLPAAGDIQAVGEWPFQILVEPENGPRTVWVGAFGYTDTGAVGGEPIAMGAIAAPVDVVPGELRYATLTLHRYFAPDADCLFDPGIGLAIVPPDRDTAALDCDDDGATTTDCNDLDPQIHPEAREDCDGVDNDCDGVCDDGLDADRDGYSRCTYDNCAGPTCVDGSDPAADVVGSCDCDDANPLASPIGEDQPNVCDGADNDCDPATGNTPNGPEQPANHIDDDCDGVCDVDADGDLIAAGLASDPITPSSWAVSCDLVRPDCSDDNGEEYPNALERCDGIDNDCDATTVSSTGPCFLANAGGCQLGARSCAELAGELGWEMCLTSSAITVSDETCATWALVEHDPWPEQAWYDLTGDDRRDTCTLDAWRPADVNGTHTNQLCADAPLMTHIHPAFVFDQGCTTQIAGGGGHGGYELELHDRLTNQRGVSVAGCDVDLVVKAVAGLGLSEVRLPSIWVLIVQTKSNGPDVETDVLPVEIRVHYADASSAFACPAGRGFDCD